MDHLTRGLSTRYRASLPVPAPFGPQLQVFVEDAIYCAATEVDTFLLQPVDYLLPTTVMVFPSDGEYSLLDVRVDLTPSWPLLGVLVVLNKLPQAP